MRNNISKLTLYLQSQTVTPVWAIANEFVIFSAAKGCNHNWINRSKNVYRLIKLADFFKIANFLIFFVGLYRVYFLMNKIVKNKVNKRDVNYRNIFVGHGANAEENIFSEYLKVTDGSVLRINSISLDGLEKINFSPLSAAFVLLFQNMFGLSQKIKKLTTSLKLSYYDFLTVAALNIGEYVFFRLFWRAAKLQGVREATFLALGPSASACIHEGNKTVYWSHGLIKLSILMEMPHSISVITVEEKAYFDNIFLKKITCDLLKKSYYDVGEKNNVALILSPEFLLTRSKLLKCNFNSFCLWLNDHEFRNILRPTPKITANEFLLLRKELHHSCVIDDVSVDFVKSLSTVKPKFVVGANSTGLFIALAMGILPISLCDPNDEVLCQNMIYPLAKKVLFWPRDRVEIEAVLHSDVVYAKNILKLKNYIDNEFFSIHFGSWRLQNHFNSKNITDEF